MNRHLPRGVLLLVGGIFIGSGTTYLIVNSRLQKKYMRIAVDEIHDAREHYKLLRGEPPYDNPVTAQRAYNARYDQLEFYRINGLPEEPEEPEIYNELITGETEQVDQIIENEEYIPAEDSPQDKQISEILQRANRALKHDVAVPMQATKVIKLDDVVSSPADIPTGNIFTDYQEPDAKELRDKEFPYVISETEYQTTELKYEKTVLRYYPNEKKHPILADERGQIISDIEGLVGKDALKHFGHDEMNPYTVFVRNDNRRVDLQIDREEMTYGEAVLGIVREE